MLLHVSVTSNQQQADISVHGHDMFSATVWDPMSTEHVMSTYLNVCLIMVTCNRNM